MVRGTALTVARSPTEGPSASTNIRHLVQELKAKLGSDAILHSIKEKSSQDSNLQEKHGRDMAKSVTAEDAISLFCDPFKNDALQKGQEMI